MRIDSSAFGAVLDALFPPACGGCGMAGSPLCDLCVPRSSRVLVRANLTVLAIGPYERSLRRAVLRFKRGRRDVAEAFADVLATRTAAFVAERATLLVGIPTTRKRARERGFDQGALLAEALARRSGLGSAALLAQVAGDAQRGRNRRARLSAQRRFVCTDPARAAGARIVLVDDVVTTGATLADGARALREAGARVTGALVLAYA